MSDVPRRSQLRCFIAMAFGHDDTDQFYANFLAPVLRKNHVTPVVINRTHSNDDLNAQIVEQLLSADFAVCDLTYARPSVYFEAGYAQRLIPVIYTVRSDHLLRGQPDDLRVHFDLQMKPLITWSDSTGKRFATQFETRLRTTILRDLNRDREAAEAIAGARAVFASLPLTQRLIEARRAAIGALTSAAFEEWCPIVPFRMFRPETVMAGQMNNVRGKRTTSGAEAVATVDAYESVPKSSLKNISQGFRYDRLSLSSTLLAGDTAGARDIHHFLLSLRGLPVSRIESALPTLSRQFEGSYLDLERIETGCRRTYWHFLAPVLSDVEVAHTVHAIAALSRDGGLTPR